MPEMVVLELDPKAIKKGWRARKDYGDIGELAESIKTIGQLQPIVVRKQKDDYVIVAGMRRRMACIKLGQNVKALVVSPKGELANLELQLAENIKRKNFDKLELGEGLKRYKVLYEKANPEVRHGGKTAEAKSLAARFTKVAAKILSISESSVKDLLGIADLPDEDKTEIETATTSRQRNKAASTALSKVRKVRKEEKLVKAAEVKQAERKAAATADGKPKRKRRGPVISITPGECAVVLPKLGTALKGGVDLVLTNPPYELKRSTISHSGRTSINEDVSWDQLDVGWVFDVLSLLAPKSSIVAFCPLEAIGDYKEVFEAAKLFYRCALVWKKTNPAPAHRATYAPSLEAMVWATKGKNYFFKEPANAGTKASHNFYEGPICSGDERCDHPTQKPLWLIRQLLAKHSLKGDRVLDPFMGTGTTLVAARMLGREAHGIEVSPKYIRQAKLRLDAL